MSPIPLPTRAGLRRAFTLLPAFGAASCILGGGLYWSLTREQTFYPFDETHDPLAKGLFARAFNPHSNKSLSDVYQARVSFSEIRPDLIEDHKRGGSRLIERYCSGVLGGWGFATQRFLSARTAKKVAAPGTDQIYTKAQILASSFEEGTKISDHFEVIEKTPNSILFRGGSPSNADGLRQVDVLMEGLVDVDEHEELVTFTLKCVFYTGIGERAPPPLPQWLTPLHLLYARSLAANGTANCKR